MCKLAEIIRNDMSFFGFAGRAMLGVPGMIWNLIKTGKAVAKSPVGSFLGNAISNVGDQYLGTGMTDREREIYQTEWLGNELAANNQRAWEERMSNTAYQRQVADMQAAGVNPALMYGNGSSGASTPSGSAGGATASSAAMGDLVGTLLQMTMQNRQLKFQKDIAQMNNATSRANAETAADASKYAADQQRTSAQEGNAIRRDEVDQVIKESNKRIDKMIVETDNERLKGDLLSIQKRIDEATATQQEAYAAHAEELVQADLDLKAAQTKDANASASLKYAETLLTNVRKDYESKLWTDEYINASIVSAVSDSNMKRNLQYQSEVDAFESYLKQCVLRGEIPDTFKVTRKSKDGKTTVVNYKVDDEDKFRIYRNLSRGYGLYGPVSTSKSTSSSFNTIVGGTSQTTTTSQSYGRP